jgi:hypothetical protein
MKMTVLKSKKEKKRTLNLELHLKCPSISKKCLKKHSNEGFVLPGAKICCNTTPIKSVKLR